MVRFPRVIIGKTGLEFLKRQMPFALETWEARTWKLETPRCQMT
jgi:hypothetical protein